MSNTYKYLDISSIKYKSFFYISIVVITTILVYLVSFKNGFLPHLDDGKLIINNLLVKNYSLEGITNIFKEKVYGLYHPITTLTWTIEYHFQGNNPWIYHFNNLLLHLLNSILVFFIVAKLSAKKEAGFFVALFYAIHPMHVESVAWLSERKDVLYAFFFLFSILIYQIYLENTKKNSLILFSFVLFILSGLSKSAAVVLPIIFLLFDFYTKRKLSSKLILEKIPFFVLSIILGIVNIITQKSDEFIIDISESYNFLERILLVSYSVCFYIFKLFVPINLSAKYFYPLKIDDLLPFSYYLSLLGIVLLIFLFVKLRKYRSEMIFGLGFFFVTIGLVLKIIPTGNDIVSDRYTYIPYIGIFYLIYCLLKNKIARNYAVILIAVFGILFSFLSIQRVKVWESEQKVWSDVIQKNPNSPVAYMERGQAYLNANLLDKAIADLNKSIEINPDFALAYFKRGSIKSKKNQYQGAIADFDKSIQLDKTNPEAYVNRGKCYAFLSQTEKALMDFNKAISLDETQTTAYNNKGIVLAGQNKTEAAILNFSKSISLNPYQNDAYANRAFAFYKLGEFEKAKLDLNKVLEKNKNNMQFLYILAQCEYKTSNHDRAIGILNSIVQKDPQNLKSIYLRGNILAGIERYKDAISDFSKIIEANPNFSDAYLNRGNSYFFTHDTENACKDWEKANALGNINSSRMLEEYCK